MGDHNPWIESTEEALHARMRRVQEAGRVQRSTLLANHHLDDCERIQLVSYEEPERSTQTEQRNGKID